MVRSANYQKNQPPQGQSDFLDQIAELLGELLLKVCFGLLVLAWLALLFPMLSLPVAGSVALGWWLGWPYGVAGGVTTVTLWGVWYLCWPGSFDRWVSGRMRQMYWKWWRYTRRWTSLMALQQLTAELDNRVLTPPLMSARIGRVVDVLEIGLVHGQKVETWEQRAEELRHSFRALGLRVRHTASGRVRVEVIHTDILRKPIPLPRVPGGPNSVDLQAVTVGITQLGQPWQLELLGTHVLCGGETGAGKGSVAWSIIAGLGPAIAAGIVVVWCIDPKGGAEMGYGMGWFDRFAYDNSQGALELLREAARVMLARLARIRPKPDRKVHPSTDEPMILLIIDEAASLTEYYADRKVKEEIERLLGLILTMGRAAGVVVVGFVQDPSKEVNRLRQLYPTRLAMRVGEATQVAMLLGQTARERGALADLISRRTPGVAYVQITPGADLTDPGRNETEELTAEIERVRAFNVTDDDIGWIIATYTPPRRYSGDTVPGEPVVIDLDDYLSTRRDDGGDGNRNRKGRTG
ncbi:cell division protein FtsK [Nocardia miyunensis]|uniref:cell division protein FtsK n=1 Tax=Nocardia miyunensis TaxID=282684 RepID=UPI000A8EEB72|nr:cell division protein FtsK [Nocardia miyunensis]